MRFTDLLGRSERSELSQMEAAELLGISERTFRRWRDRHRESRVEGLADRRLAPSVRCAETRSAHRKKRPRRPLVGMLLHQDASTHACGLWHVGDDEASVWLNVYVLDFLLHARETGFSVPGLATASAAAWIEQATAIATIEEGGGYEEPTQPTRSYAAYVLARSDRVDPGRLRALAADLQWPMQGGAIKPETMAWREGVRLAEPLALAQLAGARSLMGDAQGAS